jgi:hypothetical protein
MPVNLIGEAGGGEVSSSAVPSGLRCTARIHGFTSFVELLAKNGGSERKGCQRQNGSDPRREPAAEAAVADC